MFLYQSIVNYLFTKSKSLGKTENFDFFEIKYTCGNFAEISKDKFNLLFDDIKYLDTVTITISINEEPFTLTSADLNNTNFWDKLSNEIGNNDASDEVILTIYISKLIHADALINLYCFESFLNFIYELNTVELLSQFNVQINRVKNLLLLYSPDITEDFYSSSVHFINDLKKLNQLPEKLFNRQEQVEKIKGVSHFSGIQDCILLPEDFYLIKANSELVKVNEIFAKTCMILLITVIHDYTFFRGTTLDFKLNGYKAFNNSIENKKIKVNSLKEYYKIYNWVLQNGSITDKMGLVRNLISLNVDRADCYTIDDSVFTSIISGYKVYEKQNVKQYIELRNKISDQLLGFSEKANKIIENFASGFQKSAMAFVSLFSSIFIIRVLTTNNFQNTFTLDATILSIAFLLVSLIYYFISVWELKQQRQRYVDSYNNMKRRNEDLLTSEDIEKILNKDKEYDNDLAFIDGKKKQYSRLWVSFIILFFGVVLTLYLITKNSTKPKVLVEKVLPDTTIVKTITNKLDKKELAGDSVKANPHHDSNTNFIKSGNSPKGK